MDFISFYHSYSKMFQDYPQRNYMLWLYRQFLTGDIYNLLPHPFERTMNANAPFLATNSTATPSMSNFNWIESARIPMSQRRPSVKSRLIKVTVEDVASFVFGKDKFPQVSISSSMGEETQESEELEMQILELLHESKINQPMLEAVYYGSVGSAAIQVCLIEGKIYYKNLLAEYLTPLFDEKQPGILSRLRERYKVLGSEFAARGFKIPKERLNDMYWFTRDFTKTQEIFYKPVRVEADLNDETKEREKLVVDEKNTITHNFGFVPVIWIKNLTDAYGSYCVDGACTFKDGIDANIELDYILSQLGRGLKYSQDPLLLIKDPNFLGQNRIDKDNPVYIAGEGGDAKMVEISGDAAHAVLAYAQVLRQTVLENIHGNRSITDKMPAHSSGRALELLHQPLLILGDMLRVSYGEFGLKELIKMVVKIAQNNDVLIKNKLGRLPKKEIDIRLIWPAWFEDTTQDNLAEANALVALKDGGIISQESAIHNIKGKYDIISVEEEINKIKKEQEEFIAMTQPTTTAVEKI